MVVDAQGGGQRPDLGRSVLVLGQNELEEIASDGPSRLNLLDLRTGADLSISDRTEAADLTDELFNLRLDLDARREVARMKERLEADHELLRSQETALLGGANDRLSAQREALRSAEERVIGTGQELETIGELRHDVTVGSRTAREELERLVAARERAARLPAYSEVVPAFEAAIEYGRRTADALDMIRQRLDEAAEAAREENLHAREEAAPIREGLERAEAGLGQITSQLRNVEIELRALTENAVAIGSLEDRKRALESRRARILNDVESSEEAVFARRAEVARLATSQIANNVVVVVDHLADASQFRSFLIDALRGSNTRAALIETVAERILPRQLLEMVESDDVASLAVVAGIAPDRAQKLIENLSDKAKLANLAKVELADSVDFRLRDGATEKSVDQLSTGQKCAVTLPIVLSETERTLILDQPEDHLDNAFLVHNIVAGLNARRLAGAQTIVATHNANIPVLGAADAVIVLASDGQHGTVSVAGPFESDDVVDRITRLMEGGRDAFARRSSFYAEHGGPNNG